MKKTISNEHFKLTLTGRNYDFIATVENVTDKIIVIAGDEFERFTVEPGEWVGILADAEGYATLAALEAGSYEIKVIDNAWVAYLKEAIRVQTQELEKFIAAHGESDKTAASRRWINHLKSQLSNIQAVAC